MLGIMVPEGKRALEDHTPAIKCSGIISAYNMLAKTNHMDPLNQEGPESETLSQSRRWRAMNTQGAA